MKGEEIGAIARQGSVEDRDERDEQVAGFVTKEREDENGASKHAIEQSDNGNNFATANHVIIL